ncbi:MAG: TonB-dependent receptor [Thiothrix sp.]|uniref:TonB-dependent receptor plug domain-containing protein n=1 Tax=Thiothrix sp. TaxID=1032 RepID=UPI00262DFCCC|nr:TonB-dependent receptor [Thiothrix sp.]MDD5395060.1 TonB-dependent receptor [Thiothrix sp.]
MMQQRLLTLLIAGICLNAWAEEPDTLGEITVTATRNEIKTQKAPGSVTIITRKAIANKGGENVLEILRGTPGVSLQGIGSGGRKTISLRGMESKHTLLLVDGKRLPASNDVVGPNTDYQYDWIPVEQIERIEVVRGPMSVLYGSDALGGVINIITRKPDKQWSGDAKLTSRSTDGNSGGDGHDLELNLSGGVRENLQLSIGGQQSRRSAVAQNDTRLTAIEGRDKQQLSVKLDWQPTENQNIKLEHIAGQEERWYDVKNTVAPKQYYQSHYDLDRQHTALGWTGQIGKTQASLRTYQNTLDVKNTASNGARATTPQNLKDIALEGSLGFTLSEKQHITLGAEKRTEKLENAGLPGGNDKTTLNALYAQDEIKLSKRTNLTLGIRQDKHEAFGNETSPRAAIVYTVTDNLTLKAGYGHGFHAPNIKQVSPNYEFNLGTYKVKSNPNLKPETNDTFDMGANYTRGKWNVDAALFDNKVKNLIDVATIAPNTYQYKNIAEARLQGGELSTRVKVSKNVDLTANYQYLDAKDNTGQRLDKRPQHTVAAGVTWKRNGWQTNLNAEYLSDQLRDISTTLTPNKVTLPSYTVWNVGTRKSINKHLEVGAGIENLTDVRLEDKSPNFKYEEYPRTLRLELRGKF